MNKFFQCRNACGDRFLTRTEREKHEMSHNDPALLDPEQREAIVKAREERAAVNAACTRRACTVAEAVSMKTIRELYGPAMEITDQAVADEYFERLVADFLADARLAGKRPSRAEAEQVQRSNLGYYAGYYSSDTRERVERLFRCVHPKQSHQESSMDALAAQYPQVRRLIEANESVAKDLELRLEPTARLEAATARFMLECSERLRAALVGA